MKKLYIIAIITLITTGCATTELDKFKNYLIKKEDFKCTENTCKLEANILNNSMKVSNSYNFKTKTTTSKKIDKYNIINTTIEYNWENNTANYHSKEYGIETNATYDFKSDNFSCTCNNENKEQADSKCKSVKKDIIYKKDVFLETIKKSKTKYFEKE